MKILFFPNNLYCGSCGVSDYTLKLSQTLADKHIEIHTLNIKEWTIRNLLNAVKQLRQIKPDIVHIQYPAACYSWKVMPMLLAYYAILIHGITLVYTVHEFANMHILSKIAVFPLTLFAKKIVFTNCFERENMLRKFFWLANKSLVIPLSYNVDICPKSLDKRATNTVVYFGLFFPNKGIERFLELARSAQERGVNYQFILLGAIAPKYIDYYHATVEKSKCCNNVSWMVGCSVSEVGEVLGSSLFAFLPYDDGASERRSSLSAAFASGLITITTIGKATTNAIANSVKEFISYDDTLNFLDRVSSDRNEQQLWIQKSLKYAGNSSWDSIANTHIYIYQEILKRKGR